MGNREENEKQSNTNHILQQKVELQKDSVDEVGSPNSEALDLKQEVENHIDVVNADIRSERKDNSDWNAKIYEKMEKVNRVWHCKICSVSKDKKSHLKVHVE